MNENNFQPDKYELYDHTIKVQEEENEQSLKINKKNIFQHKNVNQKQQTNQNTVVESKKNQESSKTINQIDQESLKTNNNQDRQSKNKLKMNYLDEKNSISKKQYQGRLQIYKQDEENLICKRFPHLKICYCQQKNEQEIQQKQGENEQIKGAVQINDYIYLGKMESALETKQLLGQGITHILNVSSSEYYKRNHYFNYLNIDVYDKNDEDVKKNFRITNRFLQEAISKNGKILVHDQGELSRAVTFILAFFINNYKISLKKGLEKIKTLVSVDVSTYFIKQLEQYDLEKLANNNLKTRLN